MEGNLSAADVALLNDRRDGDMFGGGYGCWIWVIFLFLIFGWGGNGFGRGNAEEGIATRAAVNDGFQFNQLDNGIRAIQNGLCDSTYALTSAIKDCCCQTQQNIKDSTYTTNRNIDSVRYDMGKGFCDTITAMNLNTRDIMEANNTGIQRILDKMCEDEKEALRQQVNALQLSATLQTQTSNIVGQLAPRAVPSYIVSSPYSSIYPPNGCGLNSAYGYGCTCGI